MLAKNPNTGINPSIGTKASHPGNFLFSNILQQDIINNTASAIHPKNGINTKNIQAQWNLPICKIIAPFAIGIQASQAGLYFNFLAIVYQTKEV